MSLNKAIKYGKEHRKEYDGAKSVAPSCRNHKGCKWCEDNRTYQSRKQIQKTNEQLKEVKNMNNIEFKSTFDEIEFNIDMKMYWEHNDKIASINEHLGEMYSYKDLEEAEALLEYDTLQEYKKALKEKCDAFDKVLDFINTWKDNKTDLKVSMLDLLQIEDILRGDE